MDTIIRKSLILMVLIFCSTTIVAEDRDGSIYQNEGKIVDRNGYLFLKDGKLDSDSWTVKNPKIFAEYKLHNTVMSSQGSFVGSSLTKNGANARIFQTGTPYNKNFPSVLNWLKNIYSTEDDFARRQKDYQELSEQKKQNPLYQLTPATFVPELKITESKVTCHQFIDEVKDVEEKKKILALMETKLLPFGEFFLNKFRDQRKLMDKPTQRDAYLRISSYYKPELRDIYKHKDNKDSKFNLVVREYLAKSKAVNLDDRKVEDVKNKLGKAMIACSESYFDKDSETKHALTNLDCEPVFYCDPKAVSSPTSQNNPKTKTVSKFIECGSDKVTFDSDKSTLTVDAKTNIQNCLSELKNLKGKAKDIFITAEICSTTTARKSGGTNYDLSANRFNALNTEIRAAMSSMGYEGLDYDLMNDVPGNNFYFNSNTRTWEGSGTCGPLNALYMEPWAKNFKTSTIQEMSYMPVSTTGFDWILENPLSGGDDLFATWRFSRFKVSYTLEEEVVEPTTPVPSMIPVFNVKVGLNGLYIDQDTNTTYRTGGSNRPHYNKVRNGGMFDWVGNFIDYLSGKHAVKCPGLAGTNF